MLSQQFKIYYSLLEEKYLRQIEQIEKYYFGLNAYSFLELKKLNNDNNYKIICIKKEQQIISYAIISITQEEIEIYKIATDPYYKNMKCASSIINEIKTNYKNKKIFIEVSDKDNTYQFYVKNKFNIYNKRNKYYIDGSNAILMVFNPNI